MASKSKTTAARTTTGHHHLPRRWPVPSGPPVVIAQHECPSAMRARVLEVPPGRDVLSCVSAFARRGRRGALVLGAAGRVADVVLRDPAALVLRGTMEILGLAGCFFPFPSPGSAGTAVFLAGPRGTVLGGAVAPGGLVAADRWSSWWPRLSRRRWTGCRCSRGRSPSMDTAAGRCAQSSSSSWAWAPIKILPSATPREIS
ncbi:AT-hook motif nuclear-localized protein 23-like [Panicum miliaceum]|uniref:AT-hook motif nuclear-localized protein 23-like n=1 Tax=Panicum miliaceum TaxID=4540 RepID=A0A3L6S5T2_PANMI|nr:AT-hook motif nuclear-localized protein 23-like [Panicum miliaceum]